MSEKRTFRVKCRVMVEGYLDVESTSKRQARPEALTMLAGGLPVLDDMQQKEMIAHDCEGRSHITDLGGDEPIGKVSER